MINNLWPLFYMYIDFSSLNCFSIAFSPLQLCEYDVSQNYGDRGVRRQKAVKLIYDLLSVWNKEIKAKFLYYIELCSIIFFSIESYCIEPHCVESYRIGSCFIYLFNMSYLWLCTEMHIALASVMEMHIPIIYSIFIWLKQKYKAKCVPNK